MPKGLRRIYGGGDFHFITCSCYRRLALLKSARRRNIFLEILEQVRKKFRFIVAGYGVMSERFHLLMSEPQLGTPSTVMQVLKQRVARRLLVGHDNAIPAKQSSSEKTMHRSSGRRVSMISMCLARRSTWRSCVTCTAIQ
jgi:REP element-mobilizing transposase RayT